MLIEIIVLLNSRNISEKEIIVHLYSRNMSEKEIIVHLYSRNMPEKGNSEVRNFLNQALISIHLIKTS